MSEFRFSRRMFLGGAAAAAAAGAEVARAGDSPSRETPPGVAPPPAAPDLPAELNEAVRKLPPYFTPPDKFQDVSRGDPVPHRLGEQRLREVGLSRETWSLEVVSDPDQPAELGKQLSRKDGTAIRFDDLLKLGERCAVRFAKVMTCLNLGCPLGMGLWEGVPLREVVWQTQPKANLRRVFYHGYHNDDPKQIFRSSLPVGRVLEDYDDLPPVILCYRLNGEFLSPERGGPVRMVVPEAYGFKSVKWLERVTLSNLASANDTYIGGNNDVDSPLKTFAATLELPRGPRAGAPLPVTGYAQVGVSGLSKVQVWISPQDKPADPNDPYFTQAPWRDAFILPPSADLEKQLPAGTKLAGALGFDAAGRPQRWPPRLGKVFWAALLPALPAGKYVLRCRTLDARGVAQPMPRPFKKSGHCAIEEKQIEIA